MCDRSLPESVVASTDLKVKSSAGGRLQTYVMRGLFLCAEIFFPGAHN